MPEVNQDITLEDIVIDEEFKYLLPPLDSESAATLEADILEHGLRDALVLWKDSNQEGDNQKRSNILIDGHNRYEILKKH